MAFDGTVLILDWNLANYIISFALHNCSLKNFSSRCIEKEWSKGTTRQLMTRKEGKHIHSL